MSDTTRKSLEQRTAEAKAKAHESLENLMARRSTLSAGAMAAALNSIKTMFSDAARFDARLAEQNAKKIAAAKATLAALEGTK